MGTVAIAILGWLMMYLILRQMVKGMGARLRREFQEQTDRLVASVEALERQAVANPSASPAVLKPAELPAAQALSPVLEQAPEAEQPVREKMPPDISAALLAAVQRFLGQKFRIRSVKLVQNPYSNVKAWAHEGRAGLHALHGGSWNGRH